VLRPMMYAIVTSDNDFSVSVMELYGTLWNFLTCVMEPNNCDSRPTFVLVMCYYIIYYRYVLFFHIHCTTDSAALCEINW